MHEYLFYLANWFKRWDQEIVRNDMISLSELEGKINEAKKEIEEIKRDIALLETEKENIEAEINSTVENKQAIMQEIEDAKLAISSLEEKILTARRELVASRERVSEFKSKTRKALESLQWKAGITEETIKNLFPN